MNKIIFCLIGLVLLVGCSHKEINENNDISSGLDYIEWTPVDANRQNILNKFSIIIDCDDAIKDNMTLTFHREYKIKTSFNTTEILEFCR